MSEGWSWVVFSQVWFFGLDVLLQHRTLTNCVKKKFGRDVILSGVTSEVLVTEEGREHDKMAGLKSRKQKAEMRESGCRACFPAVELIAWAGMESTVRSRGRPRKLVAEGLRMPSRMALSEGHERG